MAIINRVIERTYTPSSTWYHTYNNRQGQHNVPYNPNVNKSALIYRRDFYSADFEQFKGTFKTSVGGLASIAQYNFALGYSWSSVGGQAALRVLNKAKSRFYDKLGPSADLGASLAEASQAINMGTERLMRIASSFLALKRGNLREALMFLGSVEMLKKHRKLPPWSVQRSASAIWLEYWFGWTPLIKDIYNATEVLSAPEFPEARVKGSASERIGAPLSSNFYSYKITGRVGAVVQVSNPNLFLANQLGLVNPITVAWELVPFSFVVDWFVNVGDFFGSLTENVGLNVTNAYHSIRVQGKFGYEFVNSTTHYAYTNGIASGFHRRPGMHSTALAVKPTRGLSVTRGATAAALVVSLFAPNRR